MQAEWSASRDFYIADNVIIGRHEPDQDDELVGRDLGQFARAFRNR